MNIQKVSRILCLLLAVLVLFGAVVRPMEVQATAIAATAGVVGITVEAAIPWILSALSVSYLFSYGTSLYSDIKSILEDKTTTISGVTALPAYSYNEAYCLDSTVVDEVANVVNNYVISDYTAACEEGARFSTCYRICLEHNGALTSGLQKVQFYWSDTEPTYSQNGDKLTITFTKPCVYSTPYGFRYFLEPDEDRPTVTASFSPYSFHSCVKQPAQSVVPPDVSENAQTLASTGIWIVDTTPNGDSTDGGKKRVLPIIGTDAIEDISDVVETDEEVEVDTSTSGNVSGGTSNTGTTTDLSGVLGWLQRIWSAITDLPSSIASAIVAGFQSFYDMVDEWFSILDIDFTDFINTDLPITLLDVLESFWTNTVEDIQNIKNNVRSIYTKISNIGKTITTSITDALTDFWTDVKTAILSIPETLADIWEWIKTIPQVLVDALAEVFVPAEGYLDAKVQTLLSRYSFLKSFNTDVTFLKNKISALGTSPPVISVPLGYSETSYSIGSGWTTFLDLSWYEKYKPTVDMIISPFLWILFIWKLFLKLPGIVGGLPGDFVMGGLNDFGLADHLPSRKAGYEIQRQSNREYIRKGGK